MKQKISIIAAMIHSPKLMVLDEPFVGLDPKAAVTLKMVMHELCEKGGAIFFSTHVLEVAQNLCNRVSMIQNGRIILSGNMEELVRDQSLEELFMEKID